MHEKGTSWAEFRRNAEELAERLGELGSMEAMTMTREAARLASTFKAWESSHPANDARVAAIQQLVELNRRAMDFLSRQKPPSSRSAGAPPSSRRPPLRR